MARKTGKTGWTIIGGVAVKGKVSDFVVGDNLTVTTTDGHITSVQRPPAPAPSAPPALPATNDAALLSSLLGLDGED